MEFYNRFLDRVMKDGERVTTYCDDGDSKSKAIEWLMFSNGIISIAEVTVLEDIDAVVVGVTRKLNRMDLRRLGDVKEMINYVNSNTELSKVVVGDESEEDEVTAVYLLYMASEVIGSGYYVEYTMKIIDNLNNTLDNMSLLMITQGLHQLEGY